MLLEQDLGRKADHKLVTSPAIAMPFHNPLFPRGGPARPAFLRDYRPRNSPGCRSDGREDRIRVCKSLSRGSTPALMTPPGVWPHIPRSLRQQPLQMLSCRCSSFFWTERSKSVVPWEACGTPGFGTVLPVDVM